MTPHVTFSMALLKVIRTEFGVRRRVREDVIRDRQDLVCHGDDRLSVPATPLNPLIQRREGGRFCPAGGRGGLDERHAQCRIAVAECSVTRRLPALSSWPGQTPPQLHKCPSLGNRVISPPVSATITSAVRCLTPGIVWRRSIGLG